MALTSQRPSHVRKRIIVCRSQVEQSRNLLRNTESPRKTEPLYHRLPSAWKGKLRENFNFRLIRLHSSFSANDPKKFNGEIG